MLSSRQTPVYSSSLPFNFDFKPVEIKSVLKQIRQLKANKAADLDNIPGRPLKAVAEKIAPSLTYIYNLSLSTGIFPNDWKTAEVTPLFKSG